MHFYHDLHAQYRADSFEGGLESHLCLALKLFLRAGMDFFMVIFGSPYRMVLDCPLEQARTKNFFRSPGVRLGLLQGRLFGFI